MGDRFYATLKGGPRDGQKVELCGHMFKCRVIIKPDGSYKPSNVALYEDDAGRIKAPKSYASVIALYRWALPPGRSLGDTGPEIPDDGYFGEFAGYERDPFHNPEFDPPLPQEWIDRIDGTLADEPLTVHGAIQ